MAVEIWIRENGQRVLKTLAELTDIDGIGMSEAKLEAFSGNAVQSLNVAVGAKGTIRYIGDHGGGLVRMSIDGTPPTTDSYAEFNARHTLNLHNVELDKVRLRGSSASSDYTIAYEVYN